MYYTDKPKSEANEDSGIDVKEPAVAYYTGRAGNAAAEPYGANPDGGWDDYDNDGEPLTPAQKTAIRRDPEFIAWEQEVIGKIMEGLADIEAGRVHPLDEVVDEILRDIENGTI